MTERVDYLVTVDGRQAKDELAHLRTQTLTLSGGLEKLDRSSTIAAKGAGALGAAFGTLGRSSSEALRNVGDIALLLSGGGAATVAMAIGTAAVVKGYEAWKGYAANAKIAKEATDAIVPALNKMTTDSLQPGVEAIQRMREELRNYGKDARQVAVDNQRLLVEQLERSKKNIEESLADLGGGGFGDKIPDARNPAGFRKLSAEQIQVVQGLNKRLPELEKSLSKAKEDLAEAVKLKNELVGRDNAAKLAADIKSRNSDIGYQDEGEWTPFSKWAKDLRAANEELEMLRSKQGLVAAPFGVQFDSDNPTQAALAALGGKGVRASGLDAIRDENTVATERMKAEWEDLGHTIQRVFIDSAAQYEGLARGAFASSTNAISTMIQTNIQAEADIRMAKLDESMQMQLQAEEMKRQSFAFTAAQFLAETGNQLVGLGTMQLFDGAGKLAASGGVDPRGYALVGIGTAAVATGIGMGAAGAGIGAGAQVAVAAAGARGAKLDEARAERERERERARKDRGVNRGGGGRAGSGGNGQTVINVTYSAAGPRPEDTGRAVARALDAHRRRTA